jgi:hypothetical protein
MLELMPRIEMLACVQKPFRVRVRPGVKRVRSSMLRMPRASSVSCDAALSVRTYPERIVVAAESQILCEHSRIIERSHHLPGRTIYDWRHYLAVIQRKPGALRNGAPFTQLPDAFKQLQSQLLRRAGGDREMAEILALVLQHDEQAVLCAVELALEAGVATKTHILNLLHRLTDGKATPASPIDAPKALRMAQEPLANAERYDALRDGGPRHAS